MALTLTLKPNEYLIVNGCVIRNASRRQTLHVENRADIIRGQDLILENDADTPTKRICFMIQKALAQPEFRDRLNKKIQTGLAQLVGTFGFDVQSNIFEAANYVSQADYYRAFVSLKPVLKHEAKLFLLLEAPQTHSQGELSQATSV
ncbi:flagellar biosynthesis repressor FlbT [Roseivivax sp. THAF40]|uniref:flagellar biosynthesis repressor FlbT n=1 Tax=Roseivivax sp. THAF40 TaxID=2587858 RepID=UPI0012681760|nr:flagellar biosynthesis repressor FlbT [Roseivivax sp. THAF40]QFT47384.1 flagellar biosynthesis repressor FlbT [Roseivivax sp. THAF40]